MATTEVTTSHLSFRVRGGDETLTAEGNFELHGNDEHSMYLTVRKNGPEVVDVAYINIGKDVDGKLNYNYNLHDESMKAQVYTLVDKVYAEAKTKIDELKPKLMLL